jgi:hypothetical protein
MGKFMTLCETTSTSTVIGYRGLGWGRHVARESERNTTCRHLVEIHLGETASVV